MADTDDKKKSGPKKPPAINLKLERVAARKNPDGTYNIEVVGTAFQGDKPYSGEVYVSWGTETPFTTNARTDGSVVWMLTGIPAGGEYDSGKATVTIRAKSASACQQVDVPKAVRLKASPAEETVTSFDTDYKFKLETFDSGSKASAGIVKFKVEGGKVSIRIGGTEVLTNVSEGEISVPSSGSLSIVVYSEGIEDKKIVFWHHDTPGDKITKTLSIEL